MASKKAASGKHAPKLSAATSAPVVQPTAAPLDIFAVLDANALLPARLSDVLMDLSIEGMYEARWSHSIEKEYVRNWSAVNRRLKGKALQAYKATQDYQDDLTKAGKRINAMRSAIGSEALLLGEDDPAQLALVPPKVHKGDKHVAASALILERSLVDGAERLGQCYLVTNNLRHLPVRSMAPLGVTVCTPGAFIDLLCQRDLGAFERALMHTIKSLKAPPMTQSQLLGALHINGAKGAAQCMSAHWQCPIELKV